jgi:hypothetical protein
LISIRLKNGYYDSDVRLKFIDLHSTGNNSLTFFIVLNPTLTGVSWVSHAVSETVEIDITSTAISGGSNIFTGFATQQRSIIQLPVNDVYFSIGRTHLNSDIITLGVSGFINTAIASGMLSWIEI